MNVLYSTGPITHDHHFQDWSELTEENYPKTDKDMPGRNITCFPCLCCSMKYHKFSQVKEHMRLCHISEDIDTAPKKSRVKRTEVVRRSQPLRKASAKLLAVLKEPKG